MASKHLNSFNFNHFSCLMLSYALLGIGCQHVLNPNISTETAFFPNGQKKRSIQFYLDSASNRVAHGNQTDWYENGNKWGTLVLKHDLLDGIQTRWHLFGGKLYSGLWRKNKQEGVWTWWDIHGDKSAECTFRNGRIIGTKKFWSNGSLVREDVYSAGSIAETTEWHPGKCLKALHGTFRNSRRHGFWKYWKPSGEIRMKGEFRNGKPWSGICGIPAFGDAGSIGGIETYGRYEGGCLVEILNRP